MKSSAADVISRHEWTLLVKHTDGDTPEHLYPWRQVTGGHFRCDITTNEVRSIASHHVFFSTHIPSWSSSSQAVPPSCGSPVWLLVILSHVALFVALTALRPTMSMSLLWASFHLVFDCPLLLLFSLLCLSSVLFSLCALRPFSSPAYTISIFSRLYFGCLFYSGCSSNILLSKFIFLCYFTHPSQQSHIIRFFLYFVFFCCCPDLRSL